MKPVIVAVCLSVFCLTNALVAQTTENPMKEKNQYAYVLKLIPRLLDEKNWTEVENQVVERHFVTLQRLQAEGKIILAGRTLVQDLEGFGIVVFEAESEEEAPKIMASDDAVQEGIMTAKLFPFRVALLK